MKEWTNKFNPFNSDKLFAHLNTWKRIKRGEKIPPPITVTLDPINACNLSCTWCNSEYILNKNHKKMSKETLEHLADFLAVWGVKSVCIAGGGEPLLNPYTANFIEKCYKNKVKTGIVTNGTMIDKFIEPLSKCEWVGISIDSGSSEVYSKLKGKDMFNKVISNAKQLIDESLNLEGRLSDIGQGHGVSYKYLLHPGNVKDVYKAAEIAFAHNFRNLHVRPFGEPWDKIGKSEDKFTYEDIQEFQEQIVRAREKYEVLFKIFGVTHKFDGNFRKHNDFKSCHAIFMQGAFMPPSGNGNFDYGLCCDRRGDDKVTLKNLRNPKAVQDFWGSEQHWQAYDRIIVKDCPRCTYQPHNQIFEKAIMEENMTYDFI